MFWLLFIRAAPNFARCFHVGVYSHILGTYSMFYYPQKMKIEEGSYEHEIQENLFIFWLFSILTLCAAFGIKTYHNIHHGRQNWKSRYEKLKDLKIGTIGFLACSVIHLVVGYMENASCAGYIVLGLAHLASSIFLGFFIMQQSYLCKFPEKRMDFQLKMTAWAILVEFFFGIWGQITTTQWIYINVVACFLTDGSIVLVHSSELYFLEDFLGKRVLCEDAYDGNEYIGDFVTVDYNNKEYNYMQMKLKHVERMIEEGFYKQPGIVTVNEISMLKLAEDQPSTLTVRSSAIHFLEELSKKRVVCMDTERNEYRGDLAFFDVDLEDGEKFWWVKLRNVEKKCGGEYVKHTKDVTLHEVVSLDFSDVNEPKKENEETAQI